MKKRILYLMLIFIVANLFAQNRLVLESTLEMSAPSWDIWGYYDSINNKEYALIGANGITIVDIEDAKNPFIVSNIPNVSNFDHKVWKNYIYTVSGSGTNGSLGYIIDISDVLNPILVDSFPSAHNLFIDENGYMYASNPGVIIYDLNKNPTKPDSLSKVGFEGHDVTVIDDIMYDFHGRYGTNIYDVSDKSNPKLLAYINDPTIEYHHQGWISKDKKYLYICDELAKGTSADISIWDITNLDDPDRVGEWSDNSATVHNIFILNNWAYTSYYAAGIRMFDVTNPNELLMTDEYDTTPELDAEGYEGVFGIYPFARNGKLLVSERKKGLYIFSFDSVRTVEEPEFNFYFEISPSYTHNYFTVKILRGNQEEINSFFELNIYNTLGQIVLNEQIELKDIYQKQFSFERFPKGTYIINLKNGDKVLRKKLIKL